MASAPTPASATAGEKQTAVRIPISVPDAGAPAAPAAASPDAPAIDATAAVSLAELDQKMADDLDQMLQGNFESIEAVLDEVFDEKAAIVQRADGSPALENKSQQGGASQSIAETEHHTARPFPIPVERLNPEPPISIPSAAREAASMIESHVSDSTANAPLNATPAAAPTAASASLKTEAANAPFVPFVVSKAAATAASNASPSLVARLFNSVLTVFVIVSIPMRFVPKSLRPLVDWAALTLLLWVPIVWTLALLNRGGTDGMTATDSELQSALQPASRLIESSDASSH